MYLFYFPMLSSEFCTLKRQDKKLVLECVKNFVGNKNPCVVRAVVCVKFSLTYQYEQRMCQLYFLDVLFKFLHLHGQLLHCSRNRKTNLVGNKGLCVAHVVVGANFLVCSPNPAFKPSQIQNRSFKNILRTLGFFQQSGSRPKCRFMHARMPNQLY